MLEILLGLMGGHLLSGAAEAALDSHHESAPLPLPPAPASRALPDYTYSPPELAVALTPLPDSPVASCIAAALKLVPDADQLHI